MSTKELLINEIEEVPEPFMAEVLDFVLFLKAGIAREKLDIETAADGIRTHNIYLGKVALYH